MQLVDWPTFSVEAFHIEQRKWDKLHIGKQADRKGTNSDRISLKILGNT